MTAAHLAGWRGAGGHNSRGALDISTQAEICPLDFRGEFRDNYLEMMAYHLARTNLAPNSWVRRESSQSVSHYTHRTIDDGPLGRSLRLI